MKWLIPIFLAGQGFDTATTLVGLRRGLEEANPFIIPHNGLGVVIVKSVLVISWLIAGTQLYNSHPKLITFLFLAGGIAGAVFGAKNLTLILK